MIKTQNYKQEGTLITKLTKMLNCMAQLQTHLLQHNTQKLTHKYGKFKLNKIMDFLSHI